MRTLVIIDRGMNINRAAGEVKRSGGFLLSDIDVR